LVLVDDVLMSVLMATMMAIIWKALSAACLCERAKKEEYENWQAERHEKQNNTAGSRITRSSLHARACSLE
jgi:hypothetical protein